MSEGITMDNKIPTLKNIISAAKRKQLFPEEESDLFPEEEPDLFPEEEHESIRKRKSVHHLLVSDVLLWKNKKISACTLGGATIVWILFQWLDYNFLTLLCCTIILVMSAQFVCSKASGVVNSSGSEVRRLVLPNGIAIWIVAQINNALGYFQDVSCGRNTNKFLLVVVCLIATAIIGSLCNFLTILYSGFVAAHILPVLYQRYEDQIDGCLHYLREKFQLQYKKLRNFRGKKNE